MMNSTRNAPAWRTGTNSVNGFCRRSFVRGPDFHSVNVKKGHFTTTFSVNGNSPLTGRPLVTAWRCRSQLLSPVTESGRNGGGHDKCNTLALSCYPLEWDICPRGLRTHPRRRFRI